MSRAIELHSRDAEMTLECGRLLGETLRGGAVIALSGPLGAGKTQFTKGLARGLGVAEDEPVVSPTFVLVREYAGRLKLFHLDAYRLASGEALWALGFEEMVERPDAVVAIEWADRVSEAIPAGALHVELSHVDQPGAGAESTLRRLRISGGAERGMADLAARFRSRFGAEAG